MGLHPPPIVRFVTNSLILLLVVPSGSGIPEMACRSPLGPFSLPQRLCVAVACAFSHLMDISPTLTMMAVVIAVANLQHLLRQFKVCGLFVVSCCGTSTDRH